MNIEPSYISKRFNVGNDMYRAEIWVDVILSGKLYAVIRFCMTQNLLQIF